MFTPKLHRVIVPINNDMSKSSNKKKFKALFLVMDYGEGDLREVFSNIPSGEFTEQHMLIITYNMLCSLKFLKSANVVHRDIKPANILINDQCHVKICDFGLSRTLPFYLAEMK